MMKMLLNVKFFIVFSAFSLKLCSGYLYQYDIMNLTTTQVIEQFGYPSEVHTAETEDGYFLEIHRIPHGKLVQRTREIPVLLLHGLHRTSVEFLEADNQPLAPLLADAGYDVWLGNFRGNSYCRNHRSLSTNDPKFWDFTLSIFIRRWHEYGVYDLPAMIDYIRSTTGRNEVLLVAPSMGVTTFLVMASERPEYQSRVRGAILIGPLARITSPRTPLRLLKYLSYQPETVEKIFHLGATLSSKPEFDSAIGKICGLTRYLNFCGNFMKTIIGGEALTAGQESILPQFLRQYFPNTIPRNFAHYGQTYAAEKFQRFDYGPVENMKRYNRLTPPEYKLESINTPVSVCVAPNDYFVPRKDLQYLLSRLNCVKNVHVVPDKNFGHLDFSMSSSAKELVYDKVLEQLEFLNNNGRRAKSLRNFENVYNKILN